MSAGIKEYFYQQISEVAVPAATRAVARRALVEASDHSTPAK